jgi:branched-subunit amino acid transport protein
LTEVWVTIAVLAVATALIRAVGPAFLGGRSLPARATDVIVLLAPALLAALVVVQTLSAPEGGRLDVDERLAGVAVAGVVLWRGGSALLTVGIAAGVTAGLRALL